ncbi:MAG: hypothetical protein DSZ16_09065 [Candidatus Thioglobus sp.]|nr:MAG: hypothetical protein DSZ13_04470 [Candidatus Thioglobus sp.]RUM77659.1 MAG: hypothetical protein DSZ14_07345 [Candidatus Thioglobus sp.]RUM79069.1 MAG: hypothetical protein DSZ16_09065 [Candidatus Thioglobus sp.]RUM85023.1 MAG: hypothetical protein DSZ18_00190 [Candidatus Thioglobus sp.]
MKNFNWKIVWAFSWMFFGLMIAYNNGITESTAIAMLSIGSLIFADMLKFIIKFISTRILT